MRGELAGCMIKRAGKESNYYEIGDPISRYVWLARLSVWCHSSEKYQISMSFSSNYNVQAHSQQLYLKKRGILEKLQVSGEQA